MRSWFAIEKFRKETQIACFTPIVEEFTGVMQQEKSPQMKIKPCWRLIQIDQLGSAVQLLGRLKNND
jgi:hypothetical protein